MERYDKQRSYVFALSNRVAQVLRVVIQALRVIRVKIHVVRVIRACDPHGSSSRVPHGLHLHERGVAR